MGTPILDPFAGCCQSPAGQDNQTSCSTPEATEDLETFRKDSNSAVFFSLIYKCGT